MKILKTKSVTVLDISKALKIEEADVLKRCGNEFWKFYFDSNNDFAFEIKNLPDDVQEAL